MSTSNKLVDLIREIVKDELLNKDDATICLVQSVNADGTLNIQLLSDIETILENIPNNSAYTFESGDYAVLYKLDNNLANAFVMSKVTDVPPELVQNTYLIGGGSSSSGGGGPIPTVNNGKLTIQKNETPVATFTANQSDDTIANITVPVNLSDLSNRDFSNITNRYQSLVSWGGGSITGGVSPIETATIDDLGGNKFAFASANTVTVQYSRDGGATWVDYGASNDDKRKLVTTSATFRIGNRSGANNSVNDQLRVILNANIADGNVYCALKRLLLYISTNGSGGSKVKVERRLISNYLNNVDTWIDDGTTSISGWSGWNSIKVSCSFGGSSSQTDQTAQIRLTFSVTSVSSTYGNLVVSKIQAIANPLWTSPSTMASTRHLYSYDINQNATFPASIFLSGFIGSSSNASYGLALPSTSEWTANKTIATVDDLSGYLPLSGGTMTGVINTPTNSPAINLRANHNDYNGIISYRTSGNEAVCFDVKNQMTSFIFRTRDSSGTAGTTSEWNQVTPSMQIKNQRVAINKLITNGNNANYNLEVNGSVGATTYTIGNAATMQYNSTTESIDFIFG